MSKIAYTKGPLSFADQLQQLKDRNLIVQDDAKALTLLSQISYYRLSAYFLPYQSTKDRFDDGTTFQQIIDTYSFDRELRLLVFDCIERIEIAIRTQFIYQMSMYYNDSHWHDNSAYFRPPQTNQFGVTTFDPFDLFQNIVSKAINARKPEVFIKHYMDKYNSPSNPPSWMSFELLTIGELSSLYKGLRHNADKKRIADFFDVHHTIFQSWLHSLAYIRNICAHHARLWNKDLAIEPEILLKPIGPWVDNAYNNNKRVFYALCMIKYLLNRANQGNRMKMKLSALFDKYPYVPIKYLGIPSDGKGNLLDWTSQTLWSH